MRLVVPAGLLALCGAGNATARSREAILRHGALTLSAHQCAALRQQMRCRSWLPARNRQGVGETAQSFAGAALGG